MFERFPDRRRVRILVFMTSINPWQKKPWALDKKINNFGLPRGIRGWVTGMVMYWGNRPHQREILSLVDIRPGHRVLDVGYGPGWLVRTISEISPEVSVAGVDPSEQMRRMAVRHNRRGVASGQVKLWVGSAEATGLSDASFDCVLSVNNLALWPDLDAGLRELARVLRPGGTLAIAWHSSAAPDKIQRSLGLPEEKLEFVRARMGELFVDVKRKDMENTVVFVAGGPL
ncbi:methyltransferase domain-containing protein (plasmid) [Nocardiopsis flavescens]|uniref:LooM2 n=1 Tax=Nocardiopsis flavescens TaxID=758803 RepID=A0A6M5K8E0_9ACTN|nr:LooM2 [Nocardiopsis flavescens]QKW32555.1 methyltransferase domain-containing protein [Nocardiopsis flavescens]